MKILNQTKNTVLADKVQTADSFLRRMQGLLGRSIFLPGEALVITHCNSIHMVFMKFAIDVVFVDKKQEVVGVVSNIQPFALSPVFWKASQAIELPTGTIMRSETCLGDIIQTE